ncbi:MAG TPA: alpha/beta hydrolase [Thermodesulfobacteriota bacterium]
MNSEEKLAHIAGIDFVPSQIQIGQYNINYITAGSGPPLILLHGINIGWAQWYANLAEFAKHFSVYALDLPGAGTSTKIDFKNCNLEKDFVETVETFIMRKNLAAGVSLIGHSLGGWIALRLAIRGKLNIRNMVLVSPMGFLDYVPKRYKPVAFYPIATLLTKTVFNPNPQKMQKFCFDVMHKDNRANLTDEFVFHLCQSIAEDKRAHPLLLINRLTNFTKIAKELVLTDQLSGISTNTLIVIGDKDPLIPAKKILSLSHLLPNAKIKIFPKTGHLPPIESSTLFNQVVIEFLK